MTRFSLIAFALLTLCFTDHANALEAPNSPQGCELPPGDLQLRKEEDQAWSVCEKWVWSCIRQGKEANLYEKKCLEPRTAENAKAREKWKFAAFDNPDQHELTSALSDEFLRTILWQREYSSAIPPQGVRIFGGYFRDPVNLENITTSFNLVIDGSVFKRGARLSNFRTEKNISFDGSNIRGQVLLLRARIDGSLFLERGIYDSIDLRDARIGSSIDAASSVFNDEFRLDRARIDGKVTLVKSRLTVINAWDTHIGGSLDLRLADVRVRMDMTGSSVNGDVRMPRLIFGRHLGGGTPSCDWDTSVRTDHILRELLEHFRDDADRPRRILSEAVLTRPAVARRSGEEDVCIDALRAHRAAAGHEVLLRDMKISGTLCLIDVTGEIGAAAPPAKALETISLDGTQANSTVLRWKDSPSQTLWRAVNFKTGYMLINLESQPRRHFIDNMDVGFIAFVKADGNEPDGDASEDFDKFLCDVTPAPDNAVAASSRDAHERLVRFFTGPANQARSAQPFSKIVDRLEESGATSTYLKTRLSEYKLAKVCSTSAFTKEWNAIDGFASQGLLQSLRQTWDKAFEKGEIRDPREHPYDAIIEGNRLVWDGVCSAGMMVYKFTVSYGHEPYNMFFYIVLFIGLFWLMLKLDKLPEAAGAAERKLGLIYAIDTFVPLPQFKLDRRQAQALPNRAAIRYYLRLHRFIGLVFAVLIFLFIYRAAQ
jgi:hypothetical protein